jgi:predicted nucleotidyltransferase component of viral defense system
LIARKLDRLQRDVLSVFFGKERGFFLTGGAALVGFHLGHRETQDLDLFTTEARPLVDGIRVDPPDEIFANKLCALLSRAEIRDLVDVWAIENAGYGLEEALAAAARKDRGLTAGQLAWVLSEIQIGDDAPIPGGVSPAQLRQYLKSLERRLARLAYPADR